MPNKPAKRKPKPAKSKSRVQTISAEELCSVTGQTDQRHRQLAAAGYFPSPIRGQYQTFKTFAGIIRYQRELINRKSNTLAAEQEQLTRARRLKAEEELAVLQGKYTENAIIGPALRNVSLHQRAELQRKIEQELIPTLGGLTVVEMLEKARPVVDHICHIFNEGTATWMGEP